jgi:hypothetical protein
MSHMPCPNTCPARSRLTAVGLAIAVSMVGCQVPHPGTTTAVVPQSGYPSPRVNALEPTSAPGTPSPTTERTRIPTPAYTPVVRIQGSGTLFAARRGEAIPEGFADLDSGTLGESDGADLVFLIQGGTDLWPILLPVSGATAGDLVVPRSGSPAPTYGDCEQSMGTLVPDHIQLWGPVAGGYVCVLTGEGRLSLVRIDAAPDGAPYSVTISYVTWE